MQDFGLRRRRHGPMQGATHNRTVRAQRRSVAQPTRRTPFDPSALQSRTIRSVPVQNEENQGREGSLRLLLSTSTYQGTDSRTSQRRSEAGGRGRWKITVSGRNRVCAAGFVWHIRMQAAIAAAANSNSTYTEGLTVVRGEARRLSAIYTGLLDISKIGR
ncbi:hypothetical protein BD310DRAFT_362405 [Dichomitus squalens]|uniref:Uncharacterized protein n=1 Tax=Dichomitus squalens TaxID=114155 RepID=A0A4V2K8G4_9APHY|nr:hypothetical protein BD310DRAFT_362405 [Dichomitus squalens]